MLESDRILLRDFKNSDINDFYEFSKDPLVGPTAGWRPHDSLRMSEQILFNKIISDGNFAIVLKKEKKVIGSIELNPSHIRQKIKAYEIGFALNPKYWGNGYAKEACELLMEYAFKKVKATIIEMCHIVDNIRSENTIKSLGLTYDGLFRKYKALYDKSIIDVKFYSMTKEDWERKYK